MLPGMDHLFTEIVAERKEADKQSRLLESPYDRDVKKKAREAKRVARREAQARAASVSAGGLYFAAKKPAKSTKAAKTKPKKALKNDPKLVAAARELRDRWLEKAVQEPGLIENGADVRAKYDVSRIIENNSEIGPSGSDVNSFRVIPKVADDQEGTTQASAA